MTGPDGTEAHAWWEVLEVVPPRLLVVRDGFAHADGRPNPDLPTTTTRVTVEDAGGGRTRMSVESLFPDAEAMDRILAMGAEEGMTLAIGQIDAILEGDAVRQG